jgi:hypothetical protein
MPSWGNNQSSLRRLQRVNEELVERLAVAEAVVEAVERHTHFRLDAIEAAQQ